MRKFLFCLLLMITSSSFSQVANWHYFVESKGALKMTARGSDLYISTNAGLIIFDKNTFAYSLLDKTNSPLPSNFITALDTDINGDVWAAVNNSTTFSDFGTTYGVSSLMKFDGSSWTEYNQLNSPLPQAKIIDLKTDTSGNVWSVTDSGQLIKFDNVNWTIYDNSNSPLSNYIYCITTDPLNCVWIGTSNGVFKFDGSLWTNYNSAGTPLLSDFVLSLGTDVSGKLWLGCANDGIGGGLNSFDGSSWSSHVAASSGLPYDWVDALIVDNASNVWLSSQASGLTRFDGTAWQTFDASNSGIVADYGAPLLADSGIVWYGSGLGLSRFDGTNWQTFNFNQVNMCSNRITNIEIDKWNNKYMQTDMDGLLKFDNVSWTVDSTHLGASTWIVDSDTNGHLWTNPLGWGIDEFDGSTWQVYSTATSSIPNDYMSKIHCDDQNNIWMGGDYNGGLTKFDGTNWTSYITSNSTILDNTLTSISHDTSGRLWITHSSFWFPGSISGFGIGVFDGTNFTYYNTSNSSLSSNFAYKVVCDKSDHLWAATRDGLSMFDGSTWTNYPTSFWGLDSCVISSIAIDLNDVVWVGTDSGLVSFDGTAWTTYTEKNSDLPMNNVSDVKADIYGNKWLAFGQAHFVGSYSGYGITVFNENGLVIMTPTAIQEQANAKPACLVFPNPFSERTNIQIQDKEPFKYADISLFNAEGQNVLKKRVNERSIELNRGQLQSGMYFYSIVSDSGKALGKGKFIVAD